jgi:oligopeptide/dipeptide ABC transporter ATP-binding protein
VIFQDPYASLDPRMTIGASIEEPLIIHRVGSRPERKGKVRALLEDVGLDPGFASRYPHEFSGGQRQRVGIARALALQPKFIVADEPVSALDVSVQAQIVNLLQDLQRRHGLTYLFISHGMAVVQHICTRVGVMYLGKLVELGETESLFERPLHPYTQVLRSSIPNPDPEAGRERIRPQADPPSTAERIPGCPFHPRCPYVMEECRVQEPPLLEIRPGHKVACFLATSA